MRNLARRTSVAAAVAVLAAPAHNASAETDLFVVSAEATSGAPLSAAASGSDVLDLLEDAVQAEQQFAGFDGRDVSVSLNYAGVADAATIDVSADGTSATLTLGPTGFTQTFSATDRDQLEDEIEDFLTSEGAGVYAEFLEAIRQQILVSVLDGNPNGATAVFASQSFRRHAIPGPEAYGGPRALSFDLDENRVAFVRYEGTAGLFDAGDFEGTRYTGQLHAGVDLTESVGLSGAYTLGYQNVEDADLFQAGLEVGLPISILGGRPGDAGAERAVSLRLIPVIQLGGAGSIDTADGGAFFGYGGNAAGAIRVGDFTFTGGVGVVAYDGLDTSFDDFDFETNLNQALLSAGGEVLWRLGNRFSVDAGATYHRFLEDAAVEDWWSPTAGVAWTASWSTLRAGYEADLADAEDFTGHRLQLSWTVSF